MKRIDTLDEWITGRVEPRIYAFSTAKIPGYLKVGDTYRPLMVRLKEWRKHFSDLRLEFEEKAALDPDTFFRDYSVHEYLTGSLGKKRLLLQELPGFKEAAYYSKEFFKDTSASEVQEAVDDIKRSYREGSGRYQFYRADTLLPKTYAYPSAGYWTPRPNQQQAIDNFIRAVENGRTNLLMYAVMRFGKSFTALCCAKEKGFRTVLVVSAKADVREEWKKTVQSADNFNKDYVFLSSDELLCDCHAVKNAQAGGKGLVVFLTLQDLQGDEIKEKHRELLEKEIDLLIIDETHFGARAEHYGEIIRSAGYLRDIRASFSEEGDDYIDIKDAEERLKFLRVKIKLHLSGTPYRILMGSEFAKEDIISFCQFSDIVKEQQAWDQKYLFHNGQEGKQEEAQYQEWDNPYFGFPQMVRFAFRPTESAVRLLEKVRREGMSYAFSELFRPRSISKDKGGGHKKFVHEKEVLELLEAIDGSRQEDSVFPFLDYRRIQEGNMCRHMVMVLPYCASCDALADLIDKRRGNFKNLGQYEIINISGVDGGKTYKTVYSIKEKIRRCEENNKKTLTLTVNRMLTGSTVEQWDTMIFLKDTASPQEYDQAVFRLQNQYIRTYRSDDGKTVKYNMKPQTLLVDFDPHRMFAMQEQKSLIYNANTETSGNDRLKERMEEELEISPVITVNKGKMNQVEAADILLAVSQYSSSRGVRDEAKDLPVDDALLTIQEIKKEIEKQAELGAKGGLKLEAYTGSQTDLDAPREDSSNPGDAASKEGGSDRREQQNSENENQDDLHTLENKFKTYYARILFFAFLTEDRVASLAEIASCCDSRDNARLLRNLELDGQVLTLMRKYMNPFMLSLLDYKIQNMSRLSHDETVDPIQRAVTAMGKFGKLSESEITTPISLACQAVDMLGKDCLLELGRNGKLLDLASKMGEFAIAVYLRGRDAGIDPKSLSDSVVSIPTSRVAFEFTRKVYKILGFSTRCIASGFYSSDLLEIRKEDGCIDYEKVSKRLSSKEWIDEIDIRLDESEGEDKKVNFSAVVGNPPYQEEAENISRKNGQKPRKNIFQHFVMQAADLSQNNAALICPGLRWMHQSGKGMKSFGKELINSDRLDRLIFYPRSSEVFEGIDIPDGISVIHLGKKSEKDTFTYEYISDGTSVVLERKKPGDALLVANPKDIVLIEKITGFVQDHHLKFLHDSILPRSLFGIESDFIDAYSGEIQLYDHSLPVDYAKKVKVLTNDKSGPAGRSKWFVVDRDAVKQNKKYIEEWQVVVSSAHPGGQDGRDNQIEIIDNRSAFGRARVALKSFATRQEAVNFAAYIGSSFIRFAFLMSDESLTSLAKFVPDLGDYSNSNPLMDFSGDIDGQLKKLMGLTKEEADYVEVMGKK